jgi:hypothetical protein
MLPAVTVGSLRIAHRITATEGKCCFSIIHVSCFMFHTKRSLGREGAVGEVLTYGTVHKFSRNEFSAASAD